MGMNTKSLIAHASPVSKCWAACLLISACLPAAVSAEVLYTFTDLGTLGGQRSLALGINDAGQVVGTSMIAGSTQDYHSFIYDNTGMHDLGDVGKPESVAYDINNSGQVAGYCFDDSGYRAFATNPTRDLGTLGSGRTEAYAINDNGLIVGRSQGPAGDWRLFSYSGTGPMRDLGSLGTGRSYPPAVNASGQIAVTSYDASGDARAVRTAPGADLTTAVDLGSLDGRYGRALGINDAGTVVGSSSASWSDGLGHTHSSEHAVLWSPSGELVDLDPFRSGGSQALAINNAGQVVGWSMSGVRESAFIYENGVLRDLNSLVALPAFMTLNRAYAINEAGQIVGYWTPGPGLDPLNARAFLLTPIPEPATLALILVGCFCVARRFRRA